MNITVIPDTTDSAQGSNRADDTLEQKSNELYCKSITGTAIVCSNVLDIVTTSILKMAGSDVADVIDGSAINRRTISNLIANKLKLKVLKNVK